MNKLIYSILLILGASCAKQSATSLDAVSVSATTAEAESGITAVSSMLDEQAGSNYSVMTSTKSIMDILVNKSYAADCMRPYFSACAAGIKSSNYSECSTGRFSLSGSAQLTYSQAACTMNIDGDKVTRTYNLLRSGPRGGILSTKSEVKTDYRGISFGGGGEITKTALGHNMVVLGKHKSLTIKESLIYDVSIRTLSPLVISGGLQRSNRTIQSGQLEVNHNKVGRTAVWSYNNVQYSSQCAHPISGTIDIVWSGSKTGQAQMTFQGCGVAQVTEGGQNSEVELSYAE